MKFYLGHYLIHSKRMYRITSQLCEVFDCTQQQLQDCAILTEFNAWLQANPDQRISNSLGFGESINREIAERFFDFYKIRKAN